MLPNGPRDNEVYENGKIITISFINELYSKNCLRMEITLEEDALIEKITERLNSTNTTLAKLESTIDSEKFSKLNEFMASLDFLEKDIMNMYQSLFLVGILGTYEIFRKYLLTTLDRTVLKIQGNEGLGTIMKKLKDKKINHNLTKYLDIDLRNALGHDWYWVKNNEFYYTIDPNLKRTKSLSLGELMVKKREIELFTRSFTDNAFEEILRIKKLQ
jgi:hypothetical protein